MPAFNPVAFRKLNKELKKLERELNRKGSSGGGGGGTSDHTALTNIGTNTHAQIDTHIADATIHYTQASISITESQISDLGTYTAVGDTISWTGVHTHSQNGIWNKVSTASDMKLILATQDTQRGQISWRSDGQASGDQRWSMGTDTVAESGSNVGTDFHLTAYSDTGVDLGNVLEVARDTGYITAPQGRVYIGDGTATINPQIRMNADATTRDCDIMWQVAGVNVGNIRYDTGINACIWQDRIGTVTNRMTLDMVDGNLTITGDFIAPTPTVPASASATGTAGTIAWDSSYIYICTATDTWKRVAIATW